MKVLLPEGAELEGFEKELQAALEDANLAGYALMGFAFREARSSRLHEIDALVVMEPGVFVCLEAKGYKGVWTGTANEKWFCNEQEIKAVGVNPYKQAERYSYVIKDRLQSKLFNEIEFWVNYFVVAPDGTKFEIEGAAINRFQRGRSIPVCNLSHIEQILGSIKANDNVINKFNEVGLTTIIGELTGMSLERLPSLISQRNMHEDEGNPGIYDSKNSTSPTILEEDHTEASGELELNTDDKGLASDTILSPASNQAQLEIQSPTVGEPESPASSIVASENTDTSVAVPAKSPFSKLRSLPLVALSVLSVGLLSSLTAFYAWNARPCENDEEVRVQGVCYKDLAKTPLIVGILTTPARYSKLRAYLRQELSPHVVDVVVEGDSEVNYQKSQDLIAKKEWDLVFALSPMNSMRAKDNSYQWVAQMFPDFPPTYQSALFVRADSPIRSINDLNATTKIALGDFNSASSFYVPVYDLYGKSMTVIPGNRSREAMELVANGSVDVGAAVHRAIEADQRFRIIHVSREIPGSGVYLSPRLSPDMRQRISKAMLDAPQEIKNDANYGIGDEPSYELLRSISLRTDEVLSCADFSRNPVRFFCESTGQGFTGRISGFTSEGNDVVRFRLERENQEPCQLRTSLTVLSRVPGGTSPGVLNRKQVRISGIDPRELESGSCEILIDDPGKLTILSGS